MVHASGAGAVRVGQWAARRDPGILVMAVSALLAPGVTGFTRRSRIMDLSNDTVRVGFRYLGGWSSPLTSPATKPLIWWALLVQDALCRAADYADVVSEVVGG